MTVYCGWVPNLSGTVCDTDSLISLMGIKDDRKLSYGVRFEVESVQPESFPCQLTLSMIYDDGESIKSYSLTFEFMDAGGLCRLVTDEGFDVVNRAWVFLRNNLDGCSNRVINCAAMDRMVELSSPSDSDFAEDACRRIAGRFVDSLETDGDFVTFLMDRSYFIPDSYEQPTYVSRAVYRSNALYLEAFLSLYGTCMPDNSLMNIRRTAEYRVRKNDIVADHFDKQYQTRQMDDANSLAMKSNALSKLGIAVAICIGLASSVITMFGIYS